MPNTRHEGHRLAHALQAHAVAVILFNCSRCTHHTSLSIFVCTYSQFVCIWQVGLLSTACESHPFRHGKHQPHASANVHTRAARWLQGIRLAMCLTRVAPRLACKAYRVIGKSFVMSLRMHHNKQAHKHLHNAVVIHTSLSCHASVIEECYTSACHTSPACLIFVPHIYLDLTSSPKSQ